MEVKIDVVPRVINGITYVPLRFIGEALGAIVDYTLGEVYVWRELPKTGWTCKSQAEFYIVR